jgi:aarF domain-containing kinase
MSLKLNETIAARRPSLSGRFERDGENPLAEVLAALADRRPPLGALRRVWALGGMQTHIGLAYLVCWCRGFIRSEDRREQERAQARANAAAAMLSTMSYLKGAAIKVGQTLANFPHMLPIEFVETLERLHFDAPPMHFALLREHVHNELGVDPQEVFSAFETQAFAAASLGQVHRAVLPSGRRVVVKIQYPGIARTIHNDFRVLGALMTPLRLTTDWEFIKAQVDDIRCVIERETDYAVEARALRRARELFRGDEGIAIPRVYEEFSSGRVLTMERIEGVHIQQLLEANPSEQARDRFGSLIWTAQARLNFVGRLLYADLNPGNILFARDGVLGLIDFGCVRPYGEAEWLLCRRWEQAIGASREERIQMLRDTVGMTTHDEFAPRHLRLLEAWADWEQRPLLQAGIFDFGDDGYLREGVDIVRQIFRGRFVRSPAMAFSSIRWIFGIRSLLYRLRARVDARAIHDREADAARSIGSPV